MRCWRLVALAGLAGLSCGSDQSHPEARKPHQAELDELLRFEDSRREQTDFRSLATSDVAFGPNPHAVVALPELDAVAGVLRGAAAVVLIDASGRELARAVTPPSPAGIALTDDGRLAVSAEGAGVIQRYRIERTDGEITGLRADDSIALPGALTVTDIAAGPGDVLYAVEEQGGRLFAIAGGKPTEVSTCHGPVDVARWGDQLAVNCLLDHAIQLRRLDPHGIPVAGEPVVIRHDGPIWGMTGAVRGGELLLALGGVEDRALERADGGFGYIDSFAFVYAVDREGARRLAAVNVSEHGVVTPKWLGLDAGADGAVAVTVAGYGSDRLAVLTWAGPRPDGAPAVTTHKFLPGTTRAAPIQLGQRAGLIAGDPLLDAWVVWDGAEARALPLARSPRSPESHVGERLFFTTLMARGNSSEGKRSRFTCETCHYEGYVDGRVHFTGRGDVHAATKPLLGLFNNRPHFTRALDKSMAKMVHNEFRVANKHNGLDPWFDLDPDDVPWLADIDGMPARLSAVALRRSLMTFLMEFTHRPNPVVARRAQWSELEAEGARLFRDRCERCHAARLVTDNAATAVPFDQWEKLVMSPQGPLVWASAEYRKTGVEPYVHDDGARTTSLRRLYKKYPYFTNGAARSIDDLLGKVAIAGDGAFFHDRAPASATRLGERERAALRAFLALL